MQRRATTAAFVLISAILSAPSLAHADGEQNTVDSAAEARQQYKDGTKAFAAKKYSEAALHFEAAASFKANAVALYTAGLAWDLAGKPERAADAYSRALGVTGLDAKQTKVATDRVEKLEQTLGLVVVTAPDPTWKVQLDSFTEVGTPAKLHGTAGTHTISVRIPNKPIEKREVTLEAGKTTNVDLREDEKKPPTKPEPEPQKGEAPPPPPQEPLPARLREAPFWTTSRAAGVGVVGLGVATLIGTALLGTSAEGAKDAYVAAPSRQGFEHASSLETLTNITLIAGGVLVAGGAVLIALPLGRDDRSEVMVKASVTPSGVMLRGSF